jgi:hypothetical protein
MESMRGPRWKAEIAKENKMFTDELSAAATKQGVDAAAGKNKLYYDEETELMKYTVTVGNTSIEVSEAGGGAFEWTWKGSSKKYPLAGDLDIYDGGIIYTEDIKQGEKFYKAYSVTPEKTLWTFDGRGEHGISADTAILDERVFFLEASGPLQYSWLVSIDLQSGKDRRVHYEEHDPGVSLSLIRGENKCLFLLGDKSGRQALYHVGPQGGVTRLSKEGISFLPVGAGESGAGESGTGESGTGESGTGPSYFVRRTFDAPWEPKGDLKKFSFSKDVFTDGIELVSMKNKLIVRRHHGERIAEDFNGQHRSKFWGEIQENSWASWNGQEADLRLVIPGQTVVRAAYRAGLQIEKPKTLYADIHAGFTKSADGNSVRWLWVGSGTPKALLVIGYGAYGLTTPTDTTRWRIYIENGFAIGFAFVRGGGDHTDEWAEAGRREGKEKGVEDFEACVRALQGATGIGASLTCIFGRSAGGYLMGTTILRNPGGSIARQVYVEAPYVDVLQTACNPKLPLTVFEYLEFGDPAHKIEDFEMMLRLSPIGGTPPEGVPGVFVLCRVGLNDRQVFAYESVKWMKVLRGNGLSQPQKKIVYVSKGVGHSAHGGELLQERAEDFCILVKKTLDTK